MKYKTKNKKIKNITKKGIMAISAMYMAVAIILFAPTQTVMGAKKHEIAADIMIELANKSRIAEGVPTLIINERLSSAANAKADDMFASQYFNHDSPSGVTPWFWINQSGYRYAFAGENLAIDFLTAEGAHDAFMNSEGHRQNILNSKYTEVGMAAKQGMFEGRESIIIVELFAKPAKIKSAAPVVSSESLVPAENKIVAVKDIQTPIAININQNSQTQNVSSNNSVNEIDLTKQVTTSLTMDTSKKRDQKDINIPEVKEEKLNSENEQENIFENYVRENFSTLAVYFSDLSLSDDSEKNNSGDKLILITKNTEEKEAKKNNLIQLQLEDVKPTVRSSEESISSNDYDVRKVMLLAFSISAILNMLYLSSKNMKYSQSI